MTRLLEISDVRFTPAPEPAKGSGLLGHVRCVLNRGLLLDGITLRSTQGGLATLSFPKRRDGRGVVHPIVRPLGSGSRALIELQILNALRAQGVLP